MPEGLRKYWASRGAHFDPAVQTHFGAKQVYTGKKGGKFFASPFGKHKKRYDPAVKRRSIKGRLRGAGGKVLTTLDKYGIPIGAGLAAIAGIYSGIQDNTAYYNSEVASGIADPTGATSGLQRYVNLITGTKNTYPEVAHLWQSTPDGWTPVKYLQYKFLGLDPQTGKYVGSAWVIPFWAGVAGTIVGTVGKMSRKLHRYAAPIQKLGIGATTMSTAGALVLPGSKNTNTASLKGQANGQNAVSSVEKMALTYVNQPN
jgi:hypothetical protein